MKKKPLWIMIALIVLVTAGGLMYFQKQKKIKSEQAKIAQKNAAEPTAALSVATLYPNMTLMPNRVASSGSIVAWQEASVASEISGLRIAQLNVDVGDYVKKGQVLAQLADDVIQAEMAQTQAALQEAQANLAEAKANVARAEPIMDTGVISKQQFSQFQTNVKVAQAKVTTVNAQLNTQKLKLRFTKIVAPDSGTIIARQAVLGSVVQTGTELFRLMRNNRIEWKAEIPTASVGQIRIGQEAVIALAGSNQAGLSPLGHVVTGRVREIAPQVASDKQVAQVWVALPPTRWLKPGMYVSGYFLMPASQTRVVPAKAVVVRDGQSYVFVVGEDSRVQMQKIVVGRLLDGKIEVISGIPSQKAIVAEGVSFLSEGDRVKVIATQGPADTNADTNADTDSQNATTQTTQTTKAGLSDAAHLPSVTVSPALPQGK